MKDDHGFEIDERLTLPGLDYVEMLYDPETETTRVVFVHLATMAIVVVEFFDPGQISQWTFKVWTGDYEKTKSYWKTQQPRYSAALHAEASYVLLNGLKMFSNPAEEAIKQLERDQTIRDPEAEERILEDLIWRYGN